MTLREYEVYRRSLPMSERFTLREETLQNDHEKARRSFLKWVCKRELYGKLQIVHVGRWVVHERGIPKFHFTSPFRSGYPQFRNYRSEAYKQWDMEFQKHRDIWEAKIQEERRLEREEYRRDFEAKVAAYDGRVRQRFHNSEAVSVFQLLGAAHELANLHTRHD